MTHPPQPQTAPKKRMPIWAIILIVIGSLFVGLIVLGAIVGPQDTDTTSSKPSATPSPQKTTSPTTKTPSPSPSPTVKPTKSADPTPTATADWDEARKADGLPPSPDAGTRQAYLDALNAIDPRIIKPGKEDQAVSRGINQCRSIKSNPDDRDKLIQSTLERFTIITRLPEIATQATGGKIIDAVHKHLCPGF